MTGLFPQVYPDELVFSICSRYHELLAYKSGYSTGRDLFGSDRIVVAVDLPNNLGRLCNSLPVNHDYTTERLINRHTLYPVFSAFISPERAESLRNDLVQSRGGAAYGRTGILNTQNQNRYLRYCPSCADEDRNKWGETYWHRIHNVPKVQVCPIHHIPIENSSLLTSYRSQRERFVTAEKTVPPKNDVPRKARSSDSHTELFSKFASDFWWLLNQRDLCADSTVTCNRYRRLLFDRSLSTYNGTIRRTELHAAFLNFYPADILNSLRCGFGPHLTTTWLAKIVQNSPKNCSQSAIHHLLLMNFLNCPVQDFFSLPTHPIDPFGQGPWPCLNPIAAHFRKPVITSCRISKTNGWAGHRTPATPIGTFACDCGFTYCRKGPDRTDTSRFHFYRIESYGNTWYASLKRLVQVHGYSVKHAALLLNVTPHIVRVELKKLHALETNQGLKQSKTRRKKNVTKATIKKYRAEWKAAIKANPGVGRTHLNQICGYRIYHDLLWHDREWFEANSPRVPSYTPAARINWKQRDLELAELARKAAADMINGPGRPVRASVTALARQLGILASIHKRPALLPLTKETIAKSVETTEQFALRRARWSADQYRNENIIPSYHQLQTRAAISDKVWNRIKAEVSSILQVAGLPIRG